MKGRDTKPDAAMFNGAPPRWALRRPKSVLQSSYDFLGAPLRMAMLPDHWNERLHLTSLRAERLGVVLDAIQGRLLDVGAGDNMLVDLYRARHSSGPAHNAALESLGVDVIDWGGGCLILDDCSALPFPDASFDTVSFVASLNHIPERKNALAEAHRVLRPGGRVLITMIGRLVGIVGHAIWWYSEDKQRQIADGELMGMDPREVDALVREAGFTDLQSRRFVYGLNRLLIGTKSV